MAKAPLCTAAAGISESVAFGQHPADFAAQVVIRRSQNRAPGIEHYRPVVRKHRALCANSFAHATFHTVTQHGFAQRSRDSKAKAGRNTLVTGPQTKGCKVTAGDADTGLINRAELGRTENPPVARE